MKRWTGRWSGLVLALALGALLVACGGGDSTDQGRRDTTGDKDTIVSPDTATPDTGGPDQVSPDTTTPDTVDPDVPTCQSACFDEWQRSCFGTGYRVCQDPDDDGCFDYSDVIACSPGTICKAGECVVSCPGQACTVVGAHKCADATTIEECGDFDSDGCLEWGNAVTCEGGLVCANGFCATSCSNACTVIGANKCEGNSVVTCGDYNSDGCLEWGDPKTCGALTCTNGYCKATCENECTTAGARKCEGNGYKTCGDTNQDGCLEWGTVLSCAPTQTCSNGFCLDVCENECTAVGAKKCDLNAIVTCGDYNSDGCLEWGTPANCAEGLICAGGHCQTTCTDECTVAKAKKCDEGGNVVVCDEHDDDGCLEWGSPLPCQEPYVCDQGNCLLTCSDECSIVGDKKCDTGSTNKYVTCDEWDDDGCLEWGTPEACDAGLVCAAGNCAVSCVSDCAVANETRCQGNAIETCGDYNDDGCLEWGTPATCEVYQQCQNGNCVQKPAPATVLINEILYDSVGAGGDTDTWVELRGPAGTNLTGYRLLGINGADGGVYNSIDLAGTIPADGRFVIAHPQADAAILEVADQTSSKVDFENGPDSVQVRYGTAIVDALGYGVFGGGTTFAGEGSAAVDVEAGHSLGRNVLGSDTNNNKADFFDYATPTPGADNVQANEAPDAALVCPTGGSIGETLTFDAGASADVDGSIVTYVFSFGDGTANVSGASDSATHAYASAGTYTVSVTVTDDGGLSDSAQCEVPIGDENKPTVTIIKPTTNKQVTQGQSINVLVDATPTPGRSISQVELFADGVSAGAPDTSAPYEFTYTIPWAQPTDSTIALTAKAKDNTGSIGVSLATNLLVRNDKPVASFTAVVSGTLKITADASGVYDTETVTGDLLVRWDWDNDGAWDTDWATAKITDHTYGADGTYTIKLGVKDAAEQISTATREITLSSLQYVSGTVPADDSPSTTWTGTIVITGDVTVPAGKTLNISEGASILFLYIDQDTNGVGDYDIEVNGTLNVNGTEAKPVVFTANGADHKEPKAWNMLRLNGAGSVIKHAVIEYADTGIDVRANATIEDTTVRSCQRGISVTSGTLDLTRALLTQNVEYGIGHTGSGATTDAVDCTIQSNVGLGVKAHGGAFHLQGSRVTGNGKTGMTYSGGATGNVTRNLISGNALEGVRVEPSGSEPNPVITYNNLYGNATWGARVVASPNLSASKSGSSGTATSSAWATPSGEVIQFLYFTYSESDTYGYYSGGVNKQGGSAIVTSSSSASGWNDVSGYGATSITAFVSSGTSSSSYNGAAGVPMVAFEQANAARELSVVSKSARIDARHNYFGVFPDVLSVVTVGYGDKVNVEGFVGEPFDDTWSKGRYYGGEAITADTDWLDDVIVTGQLDVTGVDTTLTIGEGVTVAFACIDANGNGVGDCDLEVTNATLVATGTSLDPVTFTDWRQTKAKKAWHRLRATGGGGVQLTNAIIEYDETGIELGTGAHQLERTTVRHTTNKALYLNSANGVTGKGLTLEANDGYGVYVSSSSNVSLGKAPGKVFTITGTKDFAFYATNSSSSLSVTNCSVTGNQSAGFYFEKASVAVDHCTISQNAYGLVYSGTTTGSLSASNIKFNAREGILLKSSGSDPTPAIHGNNIYGNSVSEASVYVDPGLSASKSGSSGTATSSLWSTPNGAKIEFFKVAYSESDTYGYYSASVLNQASSNVWSSSSSASARFVDMSEGSITGVMAQVSSGTSSSSYNGTCTVSGVLYYADAATSQAKELAAVTDGGTVSCTDNYWGLNLEHLSDLPSKLSLGRSNAVDYSGQVGTEKSGTGPQ